MLPILFESLMIAGLGFADTFMVSFLGDTAVAGVALVNRIDNFAKQFFIALATGGSVVMAQYIGAKDQKNAKSALVGNIRIVVLLGVLFAGLMLVFKNQIVSLLFGGAEKDVLRVSKTFLTWTAISYPLNALYNAGTASFRAMGESKIPSLAAVVMMILNLLFKYLFLFVFDMGVAGAALATVLSQAVGAVWILRFLTGKQTILHLRKENMKLKPAIFKPCLGLGISTFVMLSTESLLSISFTSSLARYGGDLAVGAMTIINSVCQLVTMPLQGFCQGGQPIISYNYGAGNASRVKKTFTLMFGICLSYATLFWGLSMLFPQMFAGIFTSDVALVNYASFALRIYMAGIFAFGCQISCQQSFMALGQAKISLFLACLRKIILLIPLIFTLPMFFENKVLAVFLAEPVSDILAATVTAIAFFTQFHKILNKKQNL